MEVIPKKVGNENIMDIAIAGVTKYFEEKALANTFVGNGTILSGVVKLLSAGAIQGVMKNKFGKAIALGFGIDGVEDILVSVMPKANSYSNRPTI